MQPQILFRDIGGIPLPVNPTTFAGNPRRPNGRTLFTVEQASARFGFTARQLVDLYAAKANDALPRNWQKIVGRDMRAAKRRK